MNRGTIRSSDILQGVFRWCPLSIVDMFSVIGLLSGRYLHDDQICMEPAPMRGQNGDVTSCDSARGVVVRSQ